MQKTIKFSDFINKKHHISGLTHQELAFFDSFKYLFYIGILFLVATTFMDFSIVTNDVITAFLYK